WAQVNGGKLITPEEKNALDEWYVRNASFWLDLRILGKTIMVMLAGESHHTPAETSIAALDASPQPAQTLLQKRNSSVATFAHIAVIRNNIFRSLSRSDSSFHISWPDFC